MNEQIAPSAKTFLTGRCHCGNLTLVFQTALEPSRMWLRACQCDFCVRHGARYVADAKGSVRYEVRDAEALVRYRFGLGTADFLLCGRCGVFVGAMLTDGDDSWAVVPVDVLDERVRFTQAAEPISWDAESVTERVDRRKTKWTPATFRVASESERLGS